MKTYSVRYKLPGQLRFHKLTNLVEDGYVDEHPMRYFITADKQRYEISLLGVFLFDQSRSDFIEDLNARREEAAREELVIDEEEVIPGVKRPDE